MSDISQIPPGHIETFLNTSKINVRVLLIVPYIGFQCMKSYIKNL